jgi:hypothetical protein
MYRFRCMHPVADSAAVAVAVGSAAKVAAAEEAGSAAAGGAEAGSEAAGGAEAGSEADSAAGLVADSAVPLLESAKCRLRIRSRLES